MCSFGFVLSDVKQNFGAVFRLKFFKELINVFNFCMNAYEFFKAFPTNFQKKL